MKRSNARYPDKICTFTAYSKPLRIKYLLIKVQKGLISVLLSVIYLSTYSQTFEGGVGLGATQYRGDLNPNYNPLTSRPGANVMARYNFSRGFSLRADATYAFLAGSDKLSNNPMNKLRDYSFTGNIMEADLLLEYNFFNFRSYGTIFKSSWTPTLFAGLGWGYIQNKKFHGNGSTETAEKTSNSPDNLYIYGFGLKKQLNDNWNINFNFAARMYVQKNNRDLLDGLGYSRRKTGDPDVNFYPLKDQTPEMARTANGKTGDRYFYASVTFSYVLYGLKCPNPKK